MVVVGLVAAAAALAEPDDVGSVVASVSDVTRVVFWKTIIKQM